MDCNATPQAEHHWLHKLIGDWTFKAEAFCGPDTSAMKTEGTETVRSVGGLWIVAEGAGQMPGGGDATMILTLGYDPARQRFIGTWLGSMMTTMFVYEGSLDADRRILTLDTEGPSFTKPGETARYQDIIEIVADDHRILRSQTLGDDGTWQQFMTAHYRMR